MFNIIDSSRGEEAKCKLVSIEKERPTFTCYAAQEMIRERNDQ
jgi:hypothetical protein